jgi:hypothetical protein
MILFPFSRLIAPNIRQKEFLKEGAVSVSQQVIGSFTRAILLSDFEVQCDLDRNNLAQILIMFHLLYKMLRTYVLLLK